MADTIEAQIPLALAGAADKEWVETDPGKAWLKLLWTDPETGGAASLLRWAKGYTAPPHVHLHDAHFIMLSGRIKVRDAEYGPGDYGYEPKGAVHDATTTLEDCVYFFVSNGPISFEADPATE
jgi:quercetin dioxygenase-like cupin family protein